MKTQEWYFATDFLYSLTSQLHRNEWMKKRKLSRRESECIHTGNHCFNFLFSEFECWIVSLDHRIVCLFASLFPSSIQRRIISRIHKCVEESQFWRWEDVKKKSSHSAIIIGKLNILLLKVKMFLWNSVKRLPPWSVVVTSFLFSHRCWLAKRRCIQNMHTQEDDTKKEENWGDKTPFVFLVMFCFL